MNFLDLLKEIGDMSRFCLTIADMRQEDFPLIHVNEKFENLTEYNLEEVKNNNCRFLQGPDTDKKVTRRLKESLVKRQASIADLKNYKKDGTPFWNRLVMLPLKISEGDFFFGVQHKITEEMVMEGSIYMDEEHIMDSIMNPLFVAFCGMEEILKKSNEKENIAEVIKNLDRISDFVLTLTKH